MTAEPERRARITPPGSGPTQTTAGAGAAPGRRDLLQLSALGGAAALGLLGATGHPAAAETLATAGPEAALVHSTQALLAAPPAATDTVLSLGFARPGDGGGAVFRRLDAAWDLQDFEAADGSRWRLIPVAGLVNVRQFGAAGDESRDDTEAIRRAADMLTRGRASVLFFPSGRYAVTGPILRFGPGDKRFAIQGQDADTTEIVLAGDLTAPLVSILGGPGADRAEWISFRELTFRNRNRRFAGDGVLIRFAYHVDWIRCRWIDLDGRALELDNYWDSNFEGCRIIGCGAPDAVDAAAAGVPFRAGRSAIWIGCTEACDTSNNLNFNACQFEASWHHQLEIDSFSRRIHLNSCKFHGRQGVVITKSQILVRGAHSGKISACVFAYGQAHDHIVFADPGGGRMARGWIVTGNDFSYAAGAALQISACAQMVVAHNHFGAIGRNGASIVIPGPRRAEGGQIVIAPNTYAAGEPAPEVADPAQVAPAPVEPLRAAGGWSDGHLVLGAHHLWVDADGRIRMKSGPPAHDRDGRAL